MNEVFFERGRADGVAMDAFFWSRALRRPKTGNFNFMFRLRDIFNECPFNDNKQFTFQSPALAIIVTHRQEAASRKANLMEKASPPLLTLTHTMTAGDVHLVQQDMAARIRHDFITKPGLKMRALARKPFRIGLWFLWVTCIVLGILLWVYKDRMDAIVFLALGLPVFVVLAIQYLVTWGMTALVRRKLRRSIGATGTWEISEEGITAQTWRGPWTQFHSFDTIPAGIVLLDQKQLPTIYFPAAALSDPAVKTRLHEILQRKFAPPVISPLPAPIS